VITSLNQQASRILTQLIRIEKTSGHQIISDGATTEEIFSGQIALELVMFYIIFILNKYHQANKRRDSKERKTRKKMSVFVIIIGDYQDVKFFFQRSK